jgi:heavy metal translocating P-type ATPase
MMPTTALHYVRPLLAGFVAFGLLAGFAVRLFGLAGWSGPIWAAATVPGLAVLCVEIVTSLRRGDVGLDIVAALSMSAALAVGENLAAAIVALMYASGQFLESFAERAARREMTALLSRVPRTALRHRDGQLEEIALDLIMPGDRLMVRQAAMTGESLPVRFMTGGQVLSGSTNVGAPFDLLATRLAAESTYAGVIRLVETAQRSRAPMSRIADRYAMVFLAVTVVLAAAAWLLTGDPVRAVAVLVVATPCPLILAVPVAIFAGLSRAAKLGILIKGGKAIEMLAGVRGMVIDKTGTLTLGHARIVSTRVADGIAPAELLRIAASLDQASKHVIAQTIVAEARSQGLTLAVPSEVVETPGEGATGLVDGRRVMVGGLKFVAGKLGTADLATLGGARPAGALTAAVAVDGKLAGLLILSDELRAGTEAMLRDLRQLGIERIVLATGDRAEVAQAITAGLSIDLVRSDLTPDQKILVVLSERKNGPVMMIGDGVNDAPALAAADIGVAMGAKGAAASAEAADVVLLVDHLDRILPAIRIARRSRFIALQSVIAGIGLSIVAMIAAALGYLVPVEGALLQEVIDVAVIFNALRALRG